MGFQPKSNLRDFDSIFNTQLDLSKLNSISKQHVSIFNTVEVTGQTILHGIPAEKKSSAGEPPKFQKLYPSTKLCYSFKNQVPGFISHKVKLITDRHTDTQKV